MQMFVVWWCQLVGVTDPDAVKVAVGIVAAAPLLAAAYLGVGVLFAAIARR
ncbi:MAG TPA: hypothetical protein VNR39_02770 [Pseudolabrys sp.]|nr:hypothetical protein [Pseudolabrys sp.]